jgi:hypothetical protein
VRVIVGSAIAALAACCVIAGCGSSTRDQVRAKVQEFATAVAHKDARKICTDVFAPALVKRFETVGLTCERGLEIFLSALHSPTLAVGRVTVNGSRASAMTLSGASGQRTSVEAVELIRTANGWRIAGLRSPSGIATTLR